MLLHPPQFNSFLAMAATLMNSEQSSDHQLAISEHKTPNSPEANVVTIALYPPSKTSPPAPAPLTPSSILLGKRKRLKPTEKKRSPLKDKASNGPSRTRLSLGKGKASKDTNDPVQVSQTMIRAREIQSTLGDEHPSFVKTMLPSHVTKCFWMGLPLRFCRSYLPKEDSVIVIEDENGEQCNLKLIAYRFGLSAGWKQFANQHKLHEEDVLVFQLVESCKFKVYIVRANDSKDVDGAVNVVNHDAQVENITPVNAVNHDAQVENITPGPLKIINITGATIRTFPKSKGRKRASSSSSSSSLLLSKVKRKYKRSKPPTELNNHPIDHSMVNSQVQGSSPDPNPLLKEVKTFKDFHIMVNNQCIDSELSEEIRKNYYNLCIEKNEILHHGVREGLYSKLVAGMIGETVNIATKIKKCKLTTRKEELDEWDSSLKCFEPMGMKVGFLRDRISTLAKLAFESEDGKIYVEAKEERNRNANEIKNLEAKLVELYESNRKIDVVLKEKAERYRIEFQKKVDAPW
ncbi:hypothetical protein QVD17_09959 [Tagetes erecta]|uniref:TF-B3 domain-containing protein n=1 Tax=Tagetes erecta TaxID=13708 RepID=A0AAD8P4E9_TARER|nr:hypothetical protein QVD17_09959 [Tagetes erecta]